MVGKLTRRDFMCRMGLCMTGLLALSEPEVKSWKFMTSKFSLTRLLFEGMACIEQFRRRKMGRATDSSLSESDRASAKMQT